MAFFKYKHNYRHFVYVYNNDTINQWKKIMNFNQSTVLGFFDSSQRSYEVPVYQRAYSWEEKN